MAAESRAERQRREVAEEKKKLPAMWKFVMYFSVIWSAVGGWMYVSGWWSSKKMGCTVEISMLDSFMGDSIAVAGLLAIVTVLGAFYHLEN